MKYNSDFRYDLKVGQLGEQKLNDILCNKKIEVKKDLQYKDTKNIYVEYLSRNKKSGLSTTEADWYAFILDTNKIFLIDTKELKKICRKKLNTKYDINGGDSNTSKGICLPLKELI
jgi:hypothetical protein|tara:strand:- start:42 stop:389 length:348 start_codon:yes stop_codon:yes gene_type:complete